ncbi:hypothetical protein ACXYMW_08240, partial [Roseivivax sp. CAU 1761]
MQPLPIFSSLSRSEAGPSPVAPAGEAGPDAARAAAGFAALMMGAGERVRAPRAETAVARDGGDAPDIAPDAIAGALAELGQAARAGLDPDQPLSHAGLARLESELAAEAEAALAALGIAVVPGGPVAEALARPVPERLLHGPDAAEKMIAFRLAALAGGLGLRAAPPAGPAAVAPPASPTAALPADPSQERPQTQASSDATPADRPAQPGMAPVADRAAAPGVHPAETAPGQPAASVPPGAASRASPPPEGGSFPGRSTPAEPAVPAGPEVSSRDGPIRPAAAAAAGGAVR